MYKWIYTFLFSFAINKALQLQTVLLLLYWIIIIIIIQVFHSFHN